MKYTLTAETKNYYGIVLHRVRYTDGSLGGWIEKESNLSQDGDAQVYGDALVYGDARVYGDALVCGDALVYGKIFCLSGFSFHVTVTPQNAAIGCQLKTHREWLRVTAKQARELGLTNIKEYRALKKLLPILFQQVKQK